MKPETQEKLKLFAANAQSVKKEFAWHNTLIKRLAALLYAQENKTMDSAAVRQCHDLIKSSTGVFSTFRGDMSLCIAALLSLSESPERLLQNTLKVYDLLKDAKLRASDYLVVAAYQIAVGIDADNYPSAAERTRAFYDGMKAYHWFYTGQDDYIFAAMLGLSDLDVGVGTERIERLYTQLKNEFWDKNGVQALAQILVLSGTSGDAAGRVLALRDVLKAQGTRLDKTYTLPSLGVLVLLPADIHVIARDLGEAQTLLRTQKGFGMFSVTKQELLLIAAGILASEYADSAKSGVITAALSTSITNIIIAQQAAMIAAISASSAAAASSSSSN